MRVKVKIDVICIPTLPFLKVNNILSFIKKQKNKGTIYLKKGNDT